MRKIYESNGIIDIYIDLEETSYHDPRTISWLWDKAKVVYSGTNTTPLMFKDNKIYLGWEDDGHLCFDHNALKLEPVYLQSLLRDGKMMIDKIQQDIKKKTNKKKE